MSAEHAAPADDGKHQNDGKPSDEQQDQRKVSGNKLPTAQTQLKQVKPLYSAPNSANVPKPKIPRIRASSPVQTNLVAPQTAD